MYRNICCKGLTLTVLLKRKVGRLSEVESEKKCSCLPLFDLVMHVFSAEIMSNYISVAYFGYRKDKERACRSCRRESECSIYNQLMHKDGLGHIFNYMQQT